MNRIDRLRALPGRLACLLGQHDWWAGACLRHGCPAVAPWSRMRRKR